MRRTGRARRITALVVAYMLALSLAVIYHGNVVNERAEKLVWTSLLQSELDHYLRRAAEDPDYRWRDTADVALYGEPGTAVQIGRAHVLTPVTNAHLVCRLLLEKKK